MKTTNHHLTQWADTTAARLDEIAKSKTPAALPVAARIAALRPNIRTLRDKGFSAEQIVQMLNEADSTLNIKVSTLRRLGATKRNAPALKP